MRAADTADAAAGCAAGGVCAGAIGATAAGVAVAAAAHSGFGYSSVRPGALAVARRSDLAAPVAARPHRPKWKRVAMLGSSLRVGASTSGSRHSDERTRHAAPALCKA